MCVPFSFTVNFSQTALGFEERTRLLRVANEGTLKAHSFLQLADAIFETGISEMSAGRHKESKKLMHECWKERVSNPGLSQILGRFF